MLPKGLINQAVTIKRCGIISGCHQTTAADPTVQRAQMFNPLDQLGKGDASLNAGDSGMRIGHRGTMKAGVARGKGLGQDTDSLGG